MQINAKTALVPVLALSLLTIGAMNPGDDTQALTARVQVLETKVKEMQAKLDAQSKSASELLVSLKAAEDAGFTAGINPRSREILLSAWRAHAKASVGGAKGGASDAKSGSDQKGR
ncbi:MAG: hypothetical protein R3F17_00470 [Planctomycetota bacterium]